MSSYQNLIIVGNLGRDPESKNMPSGDMIASFSVAVSESRKDKASGERHDETEWFRCVAFGRTAEVCSQYLRKGSKVLIQGRLKTRKYTAKDGTEKSTTEVLVDAMKMLDTKRESGDESYTPPSTDRNNTRSPQKGNEFFDEDQIPF